MTKYKTQNLRNTFRNARKGMRLSLKSERNIRIHIIVAIPALILGFCLNFSIVKFCILLMTITSVLAAEMFNSAIEFSLDSIYHNKYSRMVGMAKDIAAGAVMLVTITAILIGFLLFAPPLIKLVVA
ncbi:diacylglycerol kinase family protein [bacterium]|nr:diacylglycerol kinase family protein [bacterium]